MHKENREKGFIGLVLLIIMALAALKYFFNWSIFEAATSEKGSATIDYILNIIGFVWRYVSVPLGYIWDNVVHPLIGLIHR